MRTMNLFISHSWGYSDAYVKLRNLLNGRGYFDFKDYSVPATNPIIGADSDRALAVAIENKMKLCSVVLIMAGKYSTYSKWINKEISIAKKLDKPIVAIKPYGAQQISTKVRAAADIEVGWRADSIVQAIRALHRS